MINFIVLGIILSIAAIWDLKKRIIPNKLIVIGLIIGLFLPIISKETNYPVALIGFFSVGSIMLFLWLISRGNFGGGDMKLCSLIGLYLGVYYGLGVIFLANLLTFILIPVFFIKKIPLRTKFPLAPFYLMGFILTSPLLK